MLACAYLYTNVWLIHSNKRSISASYIFLRYAFPLAPTPFDLFNDSKYKHTSSGFAEKLYTPTSLFFRMQTVSFKLNSLSSITMIMSLLSFASAHFEKPEQKVFKIKDSPIPLNFRTRKIWRLRKSQGPRLRPEPLGRRYCCHPDLQSPPLP